MASPNLQQHRLVIEKTGKPILMVGCLYLEEVSIAEQVSKGGIALPNVDPEKKFDKIELGLVRACSEQYRDMHGKVYEDGAIRNWPIPEGSLVGYKKHQAWKPPEEWDKIVVVNCFDLVACWKPGDFKIKEENS
jgi:hypothetical protein